MATTIEVNGQETIDFGATGEAAILQCVRTIVSTIQGTVPLDRSFGIDGSVLDQPITVAPALLAATIIDAVSTYEPRVQIKQVDFRTDNDSGNLIPIIILEFVDESEVS